MAGPAEKESLIRPLSRTCDGCTLFESSSTIDPLPCSACSRGGFTCQGASHGCASGCSSSEFLTCAIELLRRSLSTCRQIGHQGAVTVGSDADRDEESTPVVSQDTPLSADWSQLHLRCSSVPLQVQMLDLVLNLDQQLDCLGQRQQQHQQGHPHQAATIRLTDSRARSGDHQREMSSAARPHSRSRSLRRSRTPLESVEEEEEHQSSGPAVTTDRPLPPVSMRTTATPQLCVSL